MRLLEPIQLGAATASNRVMFGPIVTNLGSDERRFTDQHTAFYERRAHGGCGVVVTEGASVHPSDWPYERAPLAERCADGWRNIATACHAHGTLVIASLDHAGGQGTSAYSQRELWAPSRVPEVNAREVPKWMESTDIDAVIAGFASAARLAVESGCDGVEVNAGQHSLVRQFLSGLTNHRGDEWADRTLFARRVLSAVRAAIGDKVMGLRLSCDELAPWAGITPEIAAPLAAELVAEGVDYLVVVRGSIYSVEKTRVDFHDNAGYNIATCAAVKAAVPATAVYLQGSLDAETAERAVADGVCDAAEITRGQLADADLVSKLQQGRRVRPCIRCNQTCQVRDNRNPIITCVVDPTTGHETDDPDWTAPATRTRPVVVLGAGPAGLETARIAAQRGHAVTVIDRAHTAGGSAALLPHAKPFIEWQLAELADAGVHLDLGRTDATPAAATDAVVVQATGSRQRPLDVPADPSAQVFDVADVLRGAPLPDGVIALLDPIGGPIAVALAERLGDRAVLITPDQIAGNELARTGDLAPANTRLAQRNVRIERRSIVRAIAAHGVEIDDRFTGERRTIECAAVVDCGFRLPDDAMSGATQVGDCVAPRTMLEAILEARRAARAI